MEDPHSAGRPLRASVPVGLVGLHLDAGAEGVERGGFVGDQAQQLDEQRGGQHLSLAAERARQIRVGRARGDEGGLGLVAHDRAGLAHGRADDRGFLRARAAAVVAVEEGEPALFDQQFAQALGVDGQERLDQVQVVRPVVRPEPFAVRGLFGFRAQGRDAVQRVQTARAAHARPLDEKPAQHAGREGFRHKVEQRRQGFLPGCGRKRGAGLRGNVFQPVARTLDRERIESVQLHEIDEGSQVFVADEGEKPRVRTAVLVDVPVIAVAAGKVSGSREKWL